MSVLEATMEKLKVLPEDKLMAVSHYIDNLSQRPRGRFDALAGCMDSAEVEKMEKAINKVFEQIDEYWRCLTVR